jgi:hypothetical protein
MILLNQIGAAVLLVSLTLLLQVSGVTALIEWLKRVLTRDVDKHGPTYSATLVVESTVAIVLLHGLAILLWPVSTGRVASRHGKSPFTSPQAVIPRWVMGTWFSRRPGGFWALWKASPAC